MPDLLSLVDASTTEDCLLFRVLEHCDVQSLRSVYGTCVLLSAAVDVYETEAWSINQFFENWFPSADLFRSVLRDSDALVYGPAVLKYLERSSIPKILHIVVGLEGLSIMGNWIEQTGYEYASSTVNFTLRNRDVERTFDDVRREILALNKNKSPIRHPDNRPYYVYFRKRTDTGTIIQLAVTRKDPFVQVLQSGYTSTKFMLNVVSSYKQLPTQPQT